MEHAHALENAFLQRLFDSPLGWHWQLEEDAHLPEPARKEIYRLYLWEQLSAHMAPFMPPTSSALSAFFDHCIHAYAQPERHYHNLTHIVHCFAELQRALTTHPLARTQRAAIALALLSHDVVYQKGTPEASDEQQSAQVLASFFPLGKSYIMAPIVALAQKLVLHTQHLQEHSQEPSPLAELMQSIDLSILAQSPVVFARYEQHIQQEYAHVPWEHYCIGRQKVLQTLLAKMPLFEHPSFTHYNQKTQTNLQNALATLHLASAS